MIHDINGAEILVGDVVRIPDATLNGSMIWGHLHAVCRYGKVSHVEDETDGLVMVHMNTVRRVNSIRATFGYNVYCAPTELEVQDAIQ